MNLGPAAAATVSESAADEHAAGPRPVADNKSKHARPSARSKPAVDPALALPAAVPAAGPAAMAAPAAGSTTVGPAATRSAAVTPTASRSAAVTPTATRSTAARSTAAQRQAQVLDLFAQPVRDHVYQSLGRPVTVLHAGRNTPLTELDLDKLRQDGFDINVVAVDADHGSRPRTGPRTEDGVLVGDLRIIPLPQRSFDIVHCSLLLDRISHVPLVLDRFTGALRPGGLLLLRIRDRDCAAGFLDRRLPGLARRALWARLYPGQPGPFPAVYEPTASGRGIAAYMLMHGLVITSRKTVRTLPHQPERLIRLLCASYRLIAWLSRGRLADTHDELLFVIRKPEDRFARVVLAPRVSWRSTCP